MKFLANENFPYKSVQYLKNKGFDLIAIGMDNAGLKDDQVMALAVEQERTILTFDRDYGELIFKYNFKPAKGVIYLRISEYTPEYPGQLIESLALSGEFTFDNALTVVDDNSIRQRKY